MHGCAVMTYFTYFFRLHRSALMAVLVGMVVLVGAVIVWINAVQLSRVSEAQKNVGTTIAPLLPLKQSELLVRSLPATASDIAGLLHLNADNAGITLEEISYESRPEHDLPIELRNASFTLTNNYTTIRHYLDNVIHAQPNLTLDALDCTRNDIASPEVNCEITVSAIQRVMPLIAGSSHVD